MKRLLLTVVSVSLILALLGSCVVQLEPPGQAEATDEAAPLMWRVTSPEGGRMYLFGSIHAATADLYPLPDFIMDAFGRSDYLAVEFDPFTAAAVAQAVEVGMLMMHTDGRTIADDIGAELHARAVNLLSEYQSELILMGVPLQLLDMFKFPLWSSVFTQIALMESGMSADYSVDFFFINEAFAHGMDILEVESYLAQIEMMLGWSPELQAALMESFLDIEAGVQGLLAMYSAWKQGDYARLSEMATADAEYLDDELFAEYWNSIARDRRILMTEAARQYMAEGKNVFFVVGASHFIGEGGIIDLLMREGYDVVLIR